MQMADMMMQVHATMLTYRHFVDNMTVHFAFETTVNSQLVDCCHRSRFVGPQPDRFCASNNDASGS